MLEKITAGVKLRPVVLGWGAGVPTLRVSPLYKCHWDAAPRQGYACAGFGGDKALCDEHCVVNGSTAHVDSSTTLL
jgi:hypothetical protein